MVSVQSDIRSGQCIGFNWHGLDSWSCIFDLSVCSRTRHGHKTIEREILLVSSDAPECDVSSGAFSLCSRVV